MALKNDYNKYFKNHFLDKMFVFLLIQQTSNEKYDRDLLKRLGTSKK